ncbi:hypothetical protein K4S71_09730 [Staphylococcus epidermidis]|nr:hypothetical protein [Staphylococcus epidermidis]MCG1591642.1 hypothetical protein [Staphylococcus epidermidis]MCG2478633.1 hypothetical protein [Staphylococcus epidermidis]
MIKIKEIKLRNLDIETYLELKKESDYSGESMNSIIKNILQLHYEREKFNNLYSDFSDKFSLHEDLLLNIGNNVMKINLLFAELLNRLDFIFDLEKEDLN